MPDLFDQLLHQQTANSKQITREREKEMFVVAQQLVMLRTLEES